MKALAILSLLLASCGTSTSSTASTAPTSTTAPTPPPGPMATAPIDWVEIPAPDDERLHCANYAADQWRVAIEHGAVVATAEVDHEPDSGPPLPFTPKSEPDPRGRRHVVAVSDGFLVGFDAGEWGGSLYWFSQDGTRQTKLGDANVHGLVVLAPNVVASVEGLSHLSISEGNVRWIERPNTSAAWRATQLSTLAAGPHAFAVTADLATIYIMTSADLERVSRTDRKAVVVQPVRTAILYPDSMVIDASNTLWVGMRQFVVRLHPTDARATHFDETFLARNSCVHATVHDLSCTCAP